MARSLAHQPPIPARLLETDDEAGLVARAQAGDGQAFALLYRRHVDAIYRFSVRRLGNREEAEDATSLVFTRALAALPAYRPGSFRAWLFAIAVNAVGDRDRERARHPEQPLADEAPVFDARPSPEELAIAGDEARTLRVLLATLPPDQRRAVELRLSGLSGEEIAAVLGRNRAAVDALHYRAVTRLRALLAEETRDAR